MQTVLLFRVFFLQFAFACKPYNVFKLHNVKLQSLYYVSRFAMSLHLERAGPDTRVGPRDFFPPHLSASPVSRHSGAPPIN